MDTEEYAKLARPVFATEREADLFALASHYRQTLERVIDAAGGRRFVFADTLRRDIRAWMMMAPNRHLLSFQTRPMSRAPRDGNPIVVIVDDPIPFAVARYRERVTHNWEDARSGLIIAPTAWVPVHVPTSEERNG